MEIQGADFRRLFDRYTACMGKRPSPTLEEDFYLYQESLTEYQSNPTALNRDAYILLRKNVELQLDDC